MVLSQAGPRSAAGGVLRGCPYRGSRPGPAPARDGPCTRPRMPPRRRRTPGAPRPSAGPEGPDRSPPAPWPANRGERRVRALGVARRAQAGAGRFGAGAGEPGVRRRRPSLARSRPNRPHRLDDRVGLLLTRARPSVFAHRRPPSATRGERPRLPPDASPTGVPERRPGPGEERPGRVLLLVRDGTGDPGGQVLLVIRTGRAGSRLRAAGR